MFTTLVTLIGMARRRRSGRANLGHESPPANGPTILSAEAKERYDEAWKRYRLSTRWFFWIWLTYMPGIFVIVWPLSFVVKDTGVVGLPVAFIWMVAWIISGIVRGQLRCPRCGRSFFSNGLFHNSFTSKCLNCGLRAYSYES